MLSVEFPAASLSDSVTATVAAPLTAARSGTVSIESARSKKMKPGLAAALGSIAPVRAGKVHPAHVTSAEKFASTIGDSVAGSW
jgi:hypothetical protein